MSDFRKLTDTVSASPQITPAEVEEAARRGVTQGVLIEEAWALYKARIAQSG